MRPGLGTTSVGRGLRQSLRLQLLVIAAAALTTIAQRCSEARNPPVYHFTEEKTPVDYPQWFGPGVLPLDASEITKRPTYVLTPKPSPSPTSYPSGDPTKVKPTKEPSDQPVAINPSLSPTSAEPTRHPTIAPTLGGDCPLFTLDFYELERGAYITTQLAQAYGVQRVRATSTNDGGFTPNDGAARVFDTSSSQGDAGLGSPNRSCGGPGVGIGGTQGEPNENCTPQGKVLIIQSQDKATPDDYENGGTIEFTFVKPVHVLDVTLLDGATNEKPLIELEYDGGGTWQKETDSAPGPNGVVTQEIRKVGVDKVKVTFVGSGSVSALRYRYCPLPENPPAMNTVQLATSAKYCPSMTMDFSDASQGQYITNQFLDDSGIIVSAYKYSNSQGYTPNDAARIFDTSNPGSTGDGSPELGSPNMACGGPGVGEAGEPGGEFSNCHAQGNALIIQSIMKSTPDADCGGGAIRFKFVRPAYVESLTILNTEAPANYTVVYADHNWPPTTLAGTRTGANGVATEMLDQDKVLELWLHFQSSNVAISRLQYSMCL